ncbi:IS3 family transposase [Micromonospora sp. NRRL B-16802]|uniref:IS3 family transposase n=1 Tax=Micromonospora sp. NRRL B-16802 TaxID=1415541 RepID=UPI0012F8D68D
MKIELVYLTSWRTRDEVEDVIFACIGDWYNTRRRQRELCYLSSDEYETVSRRRETGRRGKPSCDLIPADDDTGYRRHRSRHRFRSAGELRRTWR